MLQPAPNPQDVQDLRFQFHCRLKIFENDDNSFKKCCNLVATSNKFGLVFVGTNSNSFQAFQTSIIDDYERPADVGNKSKRKLDDVIDYPRRTIALSSPPTHLAVNCQDTILAVVIERDKCLFAQFFSIESLCNKQDQILCVVRLSPTPDTTVIDVGWHPTIAEIFTACKSDGSLGIYEYKNPGVEINEIPFNAGITAFCWSPKGKQIAGGTRDGKIVQYKPDTTLAKSIEAPSLGNPHSIAAIQWISTYRFIAVYKSQAGQPLIMVVDAPKTGNVIYTNYDDICYSNTSLRPVQYYMDFITAWNLMTVVSSNSAEVGVLGMVSESQWVQWTLEDSFRAELPLSTSHKDTLPIGVTMALNATKNVRLGEEVLSPAPFLLLLSDHGVLCCFRFINTRQNVQNICVAPNPIVFNADPYVPPKIEPPTKVEVPNSPAPPPINQMAFQMPTIEKTTLSFQTTTEKTSNNTTFNQSGSETAIGKVMLNPSISIQPVIPPSTPTIIPTTINLPSNCPVDPISTPSKSASAVAPEVEDDINTAIMYSRLISEECEFLDREVKILRSRNRNILFDSVGTEKEMETIVQMTQAMETFMREIEEVCASQQSEVHVLKQQLLEAYAWYEDGRSRHRTAHNSTLAFIARTRPLDPISEKRLSELKHLDYYMSSQIAEANRALDERWERFQDSCSTKQRFRLPTMEIIFRTMVKHNALVGKLQYHLKDIGVHLRKESRTTSVIPALLKSVGSIDELQDEIRHLRLDPTDVMALRKERIANRVKALNPNKVQKLSEYLRSAKIKQVVASKPIIKDDTISFGATPLATKDSKVVRKINFIHSTPKPAEIVPVVPPNTPALRQGTMFKPNDATVKPHTTVAIGNAPSLVQTSKTEPPKTIQGVIVSGKDTMFFVPTDKENQLKFAAKLANTSIQTPQQTITPNASTTSSIFTIPSSKPAFVVAKTQAVTPTTTSLFWSPQTSLWTTQTAGNTLFDSKNKTATVVPSVGAKTTSNPPSFLWSAAATTGPTNTANTNPITVPSVVPKFTFNAANAVTTATTALTAALGATNTFSSSFVPIQSNNQAIKTALGATTKPLFFGISTNTTGTASVTSSAVIAPTTTVTATIFSAVTTSGKVEKSSAPSTVSSTGSIFGGVLNLQSTTKSGSIIGATSPTAVISITTTSVPTTTVKPTSIFSAVTSAGVTTASSLASIFGTVTTSTPATVSQSGGSIFGAATTLQSSTTSVGSIFGANTLSQSSPKSSSIFATSIAATTGSITQPVTTSTVFGSGTWVFGGVTTASVATPEIKTSTITASTPSTTSAFAFKFETKPTSTTAAVPVVQPVVTTASPIPLTTPKTQVVFPSFASTASSTTTSFFGTAPTTAVASASPALPISSAATAAVAPTTKQQFGFNRFGMFAPANTTATTTASFFGATPSTTTVFGSTAATATTAAFGSTSGTTGSGTVFDSNPTSTGTSVFGSTPATSSSVFGSTPATPSSVFGTVSTSAPAFGSSQTLPFGGAAQTSSPAFGATPTSFAFAASTSTPQSTGFSFVGAQTSSPFGVTTTAAPASNTGSLFGQPATPATTASIFGGATTTPAFGSSLFGAKPTFGTGSVFGSPTATTTPFGFGGTAATTTTTTATFGFGTLNVGTTASNAFGGSGGAGGAFGGTQPANPFQSKSVFGSTTTTSPFGTAATTSASSTGSIFGQPSSFGFGQQTSVFGQTSNAGAFGGMQPGSFSGGGNVVGQSGFGTPAAPTSSPTFQKPAGGGVFGGPPTFGGSPAFGSAPAFGSSPTFGSPPAFGGASKVFGAASPTTGGMFGSPSAAQSNFGNLADQNTVGFGNLAQQAASPSITPQFSGNSSFSSWR